MDGYGICKYENSMKRYKMFATVVEESNRKMSLRIIKNEAED